MPRLSPSKKDDAVAASDSDPARSTLFVHSMPGHIVRRLQQVAVRLFNEEVGADLTPVQFASLCAIADRPNIGQAALASLIGYDRATIGGVIDRLEQKGMLERAPSPDDRRSNVLILTQAGQNAVASNKRKVEAVQRKLLAPLSDTEKRLFEGMCLKILSHHKG